MSDPAPPTSKGQKLAKRMNLNSESEDDNDLGINMKIRSVHDIKALGKSNIANTQLSDMLRDREKLIQAKQMAAETKYTPENEISKRDILLSKDVEGIAYKTDSNGKIKISILDKDDKSELNRLGLR
jgi:hypothetical protein